MKPQNLLDLKLIDKMTDLVLRHCPVIQFDENHIGYDHANQVLRSICKVKYDANRLITRSTTITTLSPGAEYFIKMPRCSGIYVRCTRGSFKNYLEITLIFYGPDAYYIREKFVKKVEHLLVRHDMIRMIQIKDDNNSYNTEMMLEPHNINDVILPSSTKFSIVSGLLSWKNSVDWYKENHMLHKIGILLYGEPGCGKSMIIRSIASMFGNATIIMPDINDVESSVRTILYSRKSIDGILIVVLEDFDMLFYNREDEEPMTGRSSIIRRNNQNATFQLLDGLYSTEDTIYIATTNHIDRLDPAMIRHGRFDIQEKIEGFDKDLTMKFLNHFGYDEEFFDTYVRDNFSYPIQPAKLQAFIMEYRSHEALNNRRNGDV